jgi:hypothetical protein
MSRERAPPGGLGAQLAESTDLHDGPAALPSGGPPVRATAGFVTALR